MLTPENLTSPSANYSLEQLWQSIHASYLADETTWLQQLLATLPQSEATIAASTHTTAQLIAQVRQQHQRHQGLDAFLQQYSLDTQEGVILMCLAEALLRIPDTETVDALIKDRLSGADWELHLKQSQSVLVNASTWGLMLSGKLLKLDLDSDAGAGALLERLISKLSEPVVRSALYAAMKIMGQQFVLGRNIHEALKNSQKSRQRGYCHSYDMLGESALTSADARRYFQRYLEAITALGQQTEPSGTLPPPTGNPCQHEQSGESQHSVTGGNLPATQQLQRAKFEYQQRSDSFAGCSYRIQPAAVASRADYPCQPR